MLAKPLIPSPSEIPKPKSPSSTEDRGRVERTGGSLSVPEDSSFSVSAISWLRLPAGLCLPAGLRWRMVLRWFFQIFYPRNSSKGDSFWSLMAPFNHVVRASVCWRLQRVCCWLSQNAFLYVFASFVLFACGFFTVHYAWHTSEKNLLLSQIEFPILFTLVLAG